MQSNYRTIKLPSGRGITFERLRIGVMGLSGPVTPYGNVIPDTVRLYGLQRHVRTWGQAGKGGQS